MNADIEKINICIATSCMSINEISEKSGIGIATINRILKGKQKPRRSTIGRIAKALNITVAEIIESKE